MIPEIVAYYIFNIYSCIAAVIVGGTTTAVVVIKLYYPRYDVFYISSQSRKGVEDHSAKATANRTRFKCTSLQLYSPNWSKIQELWRLPKPPRLTYGFQGYLYNRVANLKMTKHIEAKRTTALAVVTRQPVDSSLLAACVLPGLFLLVFIMVVIIKCRRAKKLRACVKEATASVTAIHSQIVAIEQQISKKMPSLKKDEAPKKLQVPPVDREPSAKGKEIVPWVPPHLLLLKGTESRKTANIERKLFKMVLEARPRNPVSTSKEIVPWVPQLVLPKPAQSDNKTAELKKEVPKKVVIREEHQRSSAVDQELSKGKEIVVWVPHLDLLKVPKSSSSKNVALEETKPKALPSLDAAHEVDRQPSCKGKEIVPWVPPYLALFKGDVKRDLVRVSDTNNVKKTCEPSLKNKVEKESCKEKALKVTKPQRDLVSAKGKISNIKRKSVKTIKYKAPKKISADNRLPDKLGPDTATSTIKRSASEGVKVKKIYKSVALKEAASATRSEHPVGTEDAKINVEVPLPKIQPGDNSKGQNEPVNGEFLLPLKRVDDDSGQKRADKKKIRLKERNKEKSPATLETNLQSHKDHCSSRRFKPLILESNKNNLESSLKRQQISRTAKKKKENKNKVTAKQRDVGVSCSDQSTRSNFSILSDKDFPSLGNSLSPEETQRKEKLKNSVDQESCKLNLESCKEIVTLVQRPVLLKATQTERDDKKKGKTKKKRKGRTAAILDPNLQCGRENSCKFKLRNGVSGSGHQSRSTFSLDSEADFPSLANKV